jgi:hypothetical protein
LSDPPADQPRILRTTRVPTDSRVIACDLDGGLLEGRREVERATGAAGSFPIRLGTRIRTVLRAVVVAGRSRLRTRLSSLTLDHAPETSTATDARELRAIGPFPKRRTGKPEARNGETMTG